MPKNKHKQVTTKDGLIGHIADDWRALLTHTLALKGSKLMATVHKVDLTRSGRDYMNRANKVLQMSRCNHHMVAINQLEEPGESFREANYHQPSLEGPQVP